MTRKSEAISVAWSEADVVMRRRANLVPDLIATVKGSAGREEGVFAEAGHARVALLSAHSVSEMMAANAQLDRALVRLLASAENYSRLKSNKDFLHLQDELAGTETRMAIERRCYNEALQDYNAYVQLFPNDVFASWAGFHPNDNYFKPPEAAHPPQVAGSSSKRVPV
jgi:LemA protein